MLELGAARESQGLGEEVTLSGKSYGKEERKRGRGQQLLRDMARRDGVTESSATGIDS